MSGNPHKRQGNQHPNIVPYQVFEASDGHVIVAAGNDGQYSRFCEIIGIPELAADERFSTSPVRLANREELIAIIAERVSTLKKQGLVDAMEANNVPGGGGGALTPFRRCSKANR